MKTALIEDTKMIDSYANLIQKKSSHLNSLGSIDHLEENFFLNQDMTPEIIILESHLQNKLPSALEEKKSDTDLLDINQPILIQAGEKVYWITLKDIHYFESCGNHSVVVWEAAKAMVYRALVSVENRLPDTQFIRVNRKHIVNINHVTAVEMWVNGGFRLTLSSGAHIEVSRRQSNCFREKFSL